MKINNEWFDKMAKLIGYPDEVTIRLNKNDTFVDERDPEYSILGYKGAKTDNAILFDYGGTIYKFITSNTEDHDRQQRELYSGYPTGEDNKG